MEKQTTSPPLTWLRFQIHRAMYVHAHMYVLVVDKTHTHREKKHTFIYNHGQYVCMYLNVSK